MGVTTQVSCDVAPGEELLTKENWKGGNMKVLRVPLPETEVLKPASKGAEPQEVYESAVRKGESCVDHLCGCK